MCSSSANRWSDIFSFVIPPSEADLSRLAKVSGYVSKLDFLSKTLETIEARLFWCHSYFGVSEALLNAIINALSRNILSEAVIQGKSFS